MKTTAVDESLSSMNQQFCSRENQLLQMLQQNEKSTKFIICDQLPETELIFGIDIQRKFLIFYTLGQGKKLLHTKGRKIFGLYTHLWLKDNNRNSEVHT